MHDCISVNTSVSSDLSGVKYVAVTQASSGEPWRLRVLWLSTANVGGTFRPVLPSWENCQ